MGVSGCGKSTVAKALAAAAGYIYVDADDYHSPGNKTKMARGQALTDDDRKDWLNALNSDIVDWCRCKQVVLACSALKESYRKQLASGGKVTFVYLKGSFELIQKRLQERRNHFMNSELLKSQFETLEEPADAIVIDIRKEKSEIVAELLAQLREGRSDAT